MKLTRPSSALRYLPKLNLVIVYGVVNAISMHASTGAV
jgi:hypothetical protein